MTNRFPIVIALIGFLSLDAVADPARKPVGFEAGRRLIESVEVRNRLIRSLEGMKGVTKENYMEKGFRSYEEFERLNGAREKIKEAAAKGERGKAEMDALYSEHGRALNQIMAQEQIAYYEGGKAVVMPTQKPLEPELGRALDAEAKRAQVVAQNVSKFNTSLRESATPGAKFAKELARGVEQTTELTNFSKKELAEEPVVQEARLAEVGKILGAVESGVLNGKNIEALGEGKKGPSNRSEQEDLAYVLDAFTLLGAGKEHFEQITGTLAEPNKAAREVSLAGMAVLAEKYMEPLAQNARKKLQEMMGDAEFKSGGWAQKPLREVLAKLQERNRTAYEELMAEFRKNNAPGVAEMLKLFKDKKFSNELAFSAACGLSDCLPNQVKFGIPTKPTSVGQIKPNSLCGKMLIANAAAKVAKPTLLVGAGLATLFTDGHAAAGETYNGDQKFTHDQLLDKWAQDNKENQAALQADALTKAGSHGPGQGK